MSSPTAWIALLSTIVAIVSAVVTIVRSARTRPADPPVMVKFPDGSSVLADDLTPEKIIEEIRAREARDPISSR